jgi:hypothetical protein
MQTSDDLHITKELPTHRQIHFVLFSISPEISTVLLRLMTWIFHGDTHTYMHILVEPLYQDVMQSKDERNA